MSRAFIVFVLFSLLYPWNARADITVERMPISDAPPVIVVTGEFTSTDDPGVLARVVGASGAKIVTFNSTGGNIISAMAYGRTIRSLGLSTLQIRSSECASACALAFVGGVNRHAEPGAIGVHQSSFAPEHTLDGQSAVAAVQRVTAHIITYLVEMGVDPRLLQLSLSVSSDDMRYLTASEMQDFKVTTNGESTLAQALQPTQSPSMANSEPQKISTEDRARAFLISYYEAWSRPNSHSLSFIGNAYGDIIRFYGKNQTKIFVVDEKQKFAERWPSRAYSPRFETVNVVCSEKCQITGIVEWFARSVAAKTSSGEAEFTFIWDPQDSKIVSEAGQVITLDKDVFEPVRIISQWQTENQACRGGAGDLPETDKACARRENVGEKLTAVGWCYGRAGEYGYQMDWHRCDPSSSTSNTAQTNASDVKGLDPMTFPAEASYSGKTKMPDFKGRDKDFNVFRTRIRNGLKNGPNFAGHYSLIQFGCGTGCSSVIVSDNNTGRPLSFPRGGEDNMYLSLKFQRNSRLIAAQWANYEQGRCVIEFFDLNGRIWKPLQRLDIGPTEACYREIDQNLE